VCWHTPIILVLWRVKQKDYKLEASLGYLTRPCLKQHQKKKTVFVDRVDLRRWILLIC
jgi:hypothetical protein